MKNTCDVPFAGLSAKRRMLGALLALAFPLAAMAQQTVFYDTFGGSTLNQTNAFPGGTPVFITERPQFGTYYSHSGYFPGYVSVVGAFPDLRVSVAIMTNDDRAELAPLLREGAMGAARAGGLLRG